MAVIVVRPVSRRRVAVAAVGMVVVGGMPVGILRGVTVSVSPAVGRVAVIVVDGSDPARGRRRSNPTTRRRAIRPVVPRA